MQASEDVLLLLADLKDNLEVLLALSEKAESVSVDVNEMYLVLSEASPILQSVTEQVSDLVIILNDLGEAEYDIHTSEEEMVDRDF